MNKSEKLFWEFFNADTAEELNSLLKNHEYIDENGQPIFKNWSYLTEKESEVITSQSQQKAALSALGEKITNSTDALIEDDVERDYLISGVKPNSYEEAINGVSVYRKGNKKNNNAYDLFLVATGEKAKNPTLSIIDRGVGQTLENFKNTFLSINKGSKSSKPYLHGYYHMGGTGILRHSDGQLILSKRNPLINNGKEIWTFTFVKSFIVPNERMPVLLYIEIDGMLPHFEKNKLSIIPSDKSRSRSLKDKNYSKTGINLNHGTFLKIYNFISKDFKSVATYKLKYSLNYIFPNLPFNIRVLELRGYGGNNASGVLKGLSQDIIEKNTDYIHDEFFISSKGGEVKITCVVSKLVKYTDNIKNKTTEEVSRVFTAVPHVLHILNTQTQGINDNITPEITDAGLSYINDSIFFIVDYSKIPIGYVSEVFMFDRESMNQSSSVYEEVRTHIKSILNTDIELKRIAEKRRINVKNDSESLKISTSFFSENSPLKNLPLNGLRRGLSFATVKLGNDHNTTTVERKARPIKVGPKGYPSFEELIKTYSKNPKDINSSHNFVLPFTTEYDTDNITFIVNGQVIESHTSLSDFNGKKLWRNTIKRTLLDVTYNEIADLTISLTKNKSITISGTIKVRVNPPKEYKRDVDKNEKEGTRKSFNPQDLISTELVDFNNTINGVKVDPNDFSYVIHNGSTIDLYLNKSHKEYDRIFKTLKNGKGDEFKIKLHEQYQVILLLSWDNYLTEKFKFDQENNKEKEYDRIVALSPRLNNSLKDAAPLLFFNIENDYK